MSLPGWPLSWSLDPRKISGYLLDETHIEGGPKARFFKRFGFGMHVPCRSQPPSSITRRTPPSWRRRCLGAAT
ncbi:DUF6883 domain-containing protein [Methylobacterium mesophilicum]